MALFGNMVVYIDGTLIAHNVTIDTELVGDDQEVDTIPLGHAGITPGPRKRRVTLSSVVPVAGEDFDFEAKMLAATEVEYSLQQIGSGKSCKSRGHITSVPRKAGVGATTTIDAVFVGTPSAFE